MTSDSKEKAEAMGRSLLASTAGILLSRVSGLARDISFAAYWGATEVAQAAYNVAFAIPNGVRMLLGEGAFNSAFVPMFTEALEKDGKSAAWRLASRAITLQFILLLALTLALSLVAGILGFSHFFQDRTADTVMQILPVLMPFAVFICLTGAFSAILNSLKSFFLPTAAQIVFNLLQVMSIGVLFWGWKNDDPAALWLFCGSTLFSGVAQTSVLMLACRRRGYVFRFELALHDDEVRTLCRKIAPGLVGAGVMQINSLIDSALGICLGAAAVGSLTYSHRLIYLPVGLFGVAMGMVALPALSRAQARGDARGVADGLDYALRTVLFLSLPCAAFLCACGDSVITFLFARGAFNFQAVQETSYALKFYLLGMPAFCCAKVATNPFYARKDTRTPVKIAMLCLALNLVLNLSLMRVLAQGGLALATSVCSWLNVFLLLYLNRRFLPEWHPSGILKDAAALLVAALSGGIACRIAAQMFASWRMPGCLTRNGAAGCQVCICLGVLTGVYLLACLLLRRPEPREFLHAFVRRRK